jgi:hypothetical protein
MQDARDRVQHRGSPPVMSARKNDIEDCLGPLSRKVLSQSANAVSRTWHS